MPSEISASIAGAPTPPRPSGPSSANEAVGRDPELWKAAKSFEAVFIAEMMSHAGVSEAGDGGVGGGGGFAEQTFRSLLAREWAEDLAQRGGVGLADQIYRSIAGSAAK